MDDDALMGVVELSKLVGLAPATVRWYSSQMPERLPPRTKFSKKPLWSRKVVARWIERRDGTAEMEQQPPDVERSIARPVARPRRAAQKGRPRRASI